MLKDFQFKFSTVQKIKVFLLFRLLPGKFNIFPVTFEFYLLLMPLHLQEFMVMLHSILYVQIYFDNDVAASLFLFGKDYSRFLTRIIVSCICSSHQSQELLISNLSHRQHLFCKLVTFQNIYR